MVGRMSDDELQPQPFSTAWVVASVLIFTAMEISIAVVLAPALLAGKLASTMLQMRVEMLMHLFSFYLGGIVVGVISPRVRLLEPAVGAFIAVILVFLSSFFLPMHYLGFSLTKIVVGGGIAFALGLVGAYTGERWMGNIPGTEQRAAVRKRLWGPDGALSGGDDRWLKEALEAEKQKAKR